MSKQIILGYYNKQKNDGLLFGLSKKAYKKNRSDFKNRVDVPETDVLISLFTDNFQKFLDKSNEFLCDRLQIVFHTQDINNGYDDDINFKFIVLCEEGQNYFSISGYRETTEEILEIGEQMRNLDYQSFKNYWKEECERELVTD
jgi:hypothetical protein